MAKKKTDDFLSQILKDTGGLTLDIAGKIPYYIDTGNLALNYMCSGKFTDGGIPGGRITEVFGPPATSKSLLGYCCLGATQRMGGIAILLDCERASSAEFASSAGHVDPSKLITYEPISIEKVKSKILGKTKIPCTACGYCMPCPYGVNIPGCFSIYNDKYLTGGGPTSSLWKYAQTLGGLSKETAFASRCTKCGKCEPHCPQGIKVRDELAKISKEIEGPLFNLALKIGRNFVRVKKR